MARIGSPRRERREENGVLYLRCKCPIHKGRWIPADAFSPQTYTCNDGTKRKTYRTLCKISDTRQKWIRGGRVPISKMRVWLEEVIRHSGGVNAAARTLNISGPTLCRWLGGTNKSMTYASAQNVLSTVKGIRDGSITPSRPIKFTIRKDKRCRQCRCPLYLSTPGCKTCDRRYYEQLRAEQERLQEAS